MEILIITAQLVLSLSILVILHELGHFIPARIFKTRVEKFYLFFDPWFSIFKIKKGETEYGIGWLPLGGYVKIAGMIDESMDKEQMKQPAQPWEFRAKPAWQRLIIMIGGVTVNLILGMFIYAMVLFVWGKEYLPIKNATNGIMITDSLAYEAGFRNGDVILEVNGIVPEDFRDANLGLLLETSSFVKVNRNNEIINIPIEKGFAEKIIELKEPVIFLPAFPPVIAVLPDTSIAAKSGLKVDDQIIAINQEPIRWFAELSPMLKNLSGKNADITVLRGKDSLTVSSKISNDGKIGFAPYGPDKFFKVETKKYSFFASFPAGIREGASTLGNYVKQFKLVFTKAGAKQVGGFASMAKQFDEKWDWRKFWGFTAFLSIALAFMNILPIPALDGGHVVFLIYEMITGKQPNEKFLEKAQLVGMVLLLSLLVFANGNDLYKWIVKLMG
jgi:regulator of sigma E protease